MKQIPKKRRRGKTESVDKQPLDLLSNEKDEVESRRLSSPNKYKRCLIGINPSTELKSICPYGLRRAQWLASNPSSNASDENIAPGCPFGLLTEDEYGYCFFKFMSQIATPLTEEEIARRMGLNLFQIRKIWSRALMKIEGTQWYEELKELYRNGELFIRAETDDDNFYYDCSLDEGNSSSDGSFKRRGGKREEFISIDSIL